MKKNILKTLALALAITSATSVLPTPQEPTLKSRIAEVACGIGIGTGAAFQFVGAQTNDPLMGALGVIIFMPSLGLAYNQLSERLSAYSDDVKSMTTGIVGSLAIFWGAFALYKNAQNK